MYVRPQWRVRLAVAALIASVLPAAARAQPSVGRPLPSSVPELEFGRTIWITTTAGREHEGRIVAANETDVELEGPEGPVSVDWDVVGLVEADLRDSLANGVRTGALTGGLGMAGFTGFVAALVCSIEGCDGADVARFTLVWSAVATGAGAGAGALIDAARPTRGVVYPTPTTVPLGGAELGDRVWVGTSDGRQVEGKLMRVSAATVDLASAGTRISLPIADVRVVRALRPDGLGNGIRNGAVIGAGAMAGVLVVGQAVGGDCCEAGTTLYWTAVGSGIGVLAGIGIDALQRTRTPVFPSQALPQTAEISLHPFFERHARGLRVSIRW